MLLRQSRELQLVVQEVVVVLLQTFQVLLEQQPLAVVLVVLTVWGRMPQQILVAVVVVQVVLQAIAAVMAVQVS